MLAACELVGASLAKVTGDLHNSVYNYIQQRPGNQKKTNGTKRWTVKELR